MFDRCHFAYNSSVLYKFIETKNSRRRWQFTFIWCPTDMNHVHDIFGTQ